MMNDANEISHQTKLYGFIGEFAGQSSLSAVLNKKFKALNKDAMIIPMNIREDDFYFTVVNMKKSHVNGAFISSEYSSKVVDILDEASELVLKFGICDVLIRDEQRLIGDFLGINVLIDFLRAKDVRKVALIGISPSAKAFAYLAKEFTIGYYYSDLEMLMDFTSQIQIVDADINRIADSMSVDFSIYDAVIDFSDFESLEMVEKLSAVNIDMKPKKEFSALKMRSKELERSYFGFDELLVEFGDAIFKYLEKNKHLEYDKSDMRF